MFLKMLIEHAKEPRYGGKIEKIYGMKYGNLFLIRHYEVILSVTAISVSYRRMGVFEASLPQD